MASTYTTSQAIVSFTATADSWSEQSSADVSVMGFPGGDSVAVSIGGQRETRRTFKALLDSVSDYKTLLGMRSRTGWLLVEDWDTDPVNAILQQVAPDPIQTDGKVYARVQFILY